MFAIAALNGNVLTAYGAWAFGMQISGTAITAQVRIAFTNGQETWTVFAVTVRLAFAASETVYAVRTAVAILFAKVSISNAFAVLVARLARMIAWIVVESGPFI